MSQKPSTHGFKWMKDEKLKNKEVIKLLKKKITNCGCVFEVDLEYFESTITIILLFSLCITL